MEQQNPVRVVKIKPKPRIHAEPDCERDLEELPPGKAPQLHGAPRAEEEGEEEEEGEKERKKEKNRRREDEAGK